MDNAFTKIRALVDADTVIGSPVTTRDGVSIIPISKVTIGFLTGGGEYSDMSRQSYTEYPFAGGSGAGVSVAPVGFLVGDGKTVKLVGVDDKSAFDKILGLIPDVVANLLDDAGKCDCSDGGKGGKKK
jgi:sporulation protein YtfJ